MLGYTEKIRETAKRLLKDCTVEMVIGFRKGTVPMMNIPYVAKTARQADDFVWDGSCGINLANYLTDRKEKRIGIMAKGCDSRNIVTHIVENKIKRDQLYIIGVPCQGMIDRRKINAITDGQILAVEENEETVLIKSDMGENRLNRLDVLQSNCTLCIHRNPVIYDELVAEPVQENQNIDRFAEVRKIEAMTGQEKWNYFENLLSACIRCYACRNACPLCYCPTCFVDESKPQWVGKSQAPMDVRTFHFLRAYHCAGRCTDCGSCERACPVGINMRVFTQKLEKDCWELYGWEAGMSEEKRPVLDLYQPDDPENFII
jgi:formate dehydrogenase subunit beta